MRSWFNWVLALAVSLAVVMMVWIVIAQAVYTGGAPWRILGERHLQHAIWLSFYTSLIASVAALLLAIPSGYALARWRFRFDWLVEAILCIPVVMSPMALGVALLLVFKVEPGFWLSRVFVFEVPGIILAQFIVSYAFAVLVLRTTFASIDIRYEQVARFLGCTRWQAFWRVTLPLARSGIIAAFVLGWARALGDFGSTSTISGAIPPKTQTAPAYIYNALQSVGTVRAVAASLVLIVVTVGSLIAVRLLLGRRTA